MTTRAHSHGSGVIGSFFNSTTHRIDILLLTLKIWDHANDLDLFLNAQVPLQASILDRPPVLRASVSIISAKSQFSYAAPSSDQPAQIVFSKWITSKTLKLVTQTSVYHWSPEDGQ